MAQYLKVGESKYSLEELFKALDVKKGNVRIALGQEVEDGAIEASVLVGDPAIYCIDVGFISQDSKTLPMILSHTEQNQGEKVDGKSHVCTYLYDRADSYLAYMPHDVRPDGELGDDQIEATLIVGGDHDANVNVYRENNFVKFSTIRAFNS